MKRIIAFVLAAACLSPLSATAGPILESAERLAREAAAATAVQGGYRQRSAARTWGGVGLMAGGVALAFSRRECRVAGALSNDVVAQGVGFSPLVGTLGVVFDEARNATAEKVRGSCFLDWTVNRAPAVISGSRALIIGRTTTGKASEIRSEFRGVDHTRGTAEAESFFPKGQLFGGLAIAAVGGLLATLWAEVDVLESVDVSVAPGRLQVGKSFGF